MKMNIFKRSFWGLSTKFWGLMLGAVVVGGQIANQYSGQINSFLNIEPFIRIDDSSVNQRTKCNKPKAKGKIR